MIRRIVATGATTDTCKWKPQLHPHANETKTASAVRAREER
jgi:hypothetical protein